MLPRYINLFRAAGSYIFSSISGRVTGKWMPPFIGIELTNHCNLSCPECISGSGQMKRPKGFMSQEIFDKILIEAGPYFFNINLYFQGEPMMHPDFLAFLKKSSAYSTTVSTNGQFLSRELAMKIAESGLKRMIVSLDGMDEESYAIYRKNGNWQKTVDGIKNLSDAIVRSGSGLKLEIQFLVNRHNERQVNTARKFAGEVNARLILKSMQVLEETRAGEWMPSGEKYRRYSMIDGRYIHKGRKMNRCLRLWLNPVVTWDGKIIPCCFDKDAEYIYGDLKALSFSEIWFGSKANEFRKKVLDNRGSIGICTNCTTGLSGVRF